MNGCNPLIDVSWCAAGFFGCSVGSISWDKSSLDVAMSALRAGLVDLFVQRSFVVRLRSTLVSLLGIGIEEIAIRRFVFTLRFKHFSFFLFIEEMLKNTRCISFSFFFETNCQFAEFSWYRGIHARLT